MSGGFQSVYWARHNWSSAPIPTSGPTWNELRKTAMELEAASRSEVEDVCSLKPSLRAEGDALLKAFPKLLVGYRRGLADWRIPGPR
jgi:hypothetical protein